jgi:hypothetical protein
MRRQVAATVGSGGASAARTAALRGQERRRGLDVIGSIGAVGSIDAADGELPA